MSCKKNQKAREHIKNRSLNELVLELESIEKKINQI